MGDSALILLETVNTHTLQVLESMRSLSSFLLPLPTHTEWRYGPSIPRLWQHLVAGGYNSYREVLKGIRNQ